MHEKGSRPPEITFLLRRQDRNTWMSEKFDNTIEKGWQPPIQRKREFIQV